jgi:ATP/maltotriose-dependent transcriptional regulator MalT/DNA-binding SARP family transcriptional activator
MGDARVLAKTTIPDLTRAIPRPRLVQRITAAGAVRVVLITGQAAQGKSTLAAEIASQPGLAGAWMHLDPSDKDPVNLFHLLVHALKASRPNLDLSAFLKNPAIALGTKTGSGRIAELAGVFMDEIIAQAPVRVVMDGLDEISDNPESLRLVDRLLDSISPPSSLVLVSRETPPLKLESLRIRQELVSLNNEDLAFTTDEIHQFYLDLFGLLLPAPHVVKMKEITDGWVGGLVLAWEALSHVPEDQRTDFISSGLPAAMHGERLAFFSEAVFSGLDGKTRNFLVRSAIFDTIDPKMIARYLQDQSVGDVQTILDTLVRKNLFIHPFLDAKTGRGYRYNQLFRDFLMEKFHTILNKDQQHRLLAQAADLAWDSRHFEEAIRFFLKAEAFEKAAAGIKKIAMGLSAQGRFADLAAWIDMLPDPLITDDAWLAFYKIMGRRISGGRRNIRDFSRALDRFSRQNDQRGELLSLAYLIEAAVFIGHPAAVLNRWLQAGWTMLEKASGNRYYPFAKATLWMQLAFGYLSGAGDLQKGLSACRNALLLAATIDDETLTVNATIIQVFGLTLSGELAAAEKALATIHHVVAAAYPEYKALQNIVRMELALSKGDLDRAQRLLDANQEDIDKFGLLFLYPIHVDLSGLLQIHQRRYDMLGRTARHLKDVATLAANPFYSGLALRLRALNAYHQQRFEHATAWAERAIAVIEPSMGESIHLFRSRLILGMATYHLGDLTGARQVLESARHFFNRESSHHSLAESYLGLSLVAKAMGKAAEAQRHLMSAIAVVTSQGYEAFPILSANDVAAACRPILEDTGAGVPRLTRRFMDRVRLQAVAPQLENEQEAATRSQRFPAAAGLDSSPPRLDIRSLGGFEVRRNGGEVIADGQWAGLRQKLLLKAIIVNGCREIPKDILMDAIWPDSGTDAALRRFKVTLHRLRRILEPTSGQRSGSSCISLKDNLVSLDMSRCRVDVDDFLAACDEIRQLRGDDDDDRRLSACRRAVDLYKGDFLPEEPYLSWAEVKRSALRDQYLAIRMEMAGLFERNGDMEQAAHHCDAVIRVDPLAEHALQQLMRLLQRQGRRSAALKAYRRLADTLATELDTLPDPATTHIYEEILNNR